MTANDLFGEDAAAKRERPLPLSLGAIMSPVKNMCHAERERTPPAFAAWLVELARRCAR